MDATTDAPGVQTHRFQAEVHRVLHLVVNSLYSHKEVFLRELVSNASDALDRLKFRAITEPALLADGARLEIRVLPDRAAGTLTLEDTGLGMTRDELVQNLGTIAHSGSRAFLERLEAQARADVSLIGQFGVGFYSAYLVADRVVVESRAAGGTEAFRWSSDGKDSFTVEPCARTTRGTAVTLHLRDEHKDFLEPWRLRELITRYSDFVGHPILMAAGEGEGALEAVNRASALWQRPRGEITAEQYAEAYRHLTHDEEGPLAWTHFRVEGAQLFVGMLFLPRRPPWDLELSGEARRGVRLFVKRVFIMERCEEIVPPWLRFVRGVIDSDDLPLNVSRETLQDSAVVRSIRKQVTRKTLDLLDELARDRPEDYKTFWQHFGRVLKEGLHGEAEHRERLAALVRFDSSRDEGPTSLADYVARMKPEQAAIYYALGESRRAVASTPHIEALRSRGYEVLYLTDLVDPWAAEGIREFQGKKLVSASKAELPLEEEAEARREREARAGALEPLVQRFRAVLGEAVRDVRLSERLTDSPCCLVVAPGGLDAHLERLLRAHGREVETPKRILELNPGHPLVEALREAHAREPASPRVSEWIEMVHEQALVMEGTPIADPGRFARRVAAVLEQVVRAAGGAVSAGAASPDAVVAPDPAAGPP